MMQRIQPFRSRLSSASLGPTTHWRPVWDEGDVAGDAHGASPSKMHRWASMGVLWTPVRDRRVVFNVRC